MKLYPKLSLHNQSSTFLYVLIITLTLTITAIAAFSLPPFIVNAQAVGKLGVITENDTVNDQLKLEENKFTIKAKEIIEEKYKILKNNLKTVSYKEVTFQLTDKNPMI